jgi:hypothetical protein
MQFGMIGLGRMGANMVRRPRQTYLPLPSLRAALRAARPISRTACCPPCVRSSVATLNGRRRLDPRRET